MGKLHIVKAEEGRIKEGSPLFHIKYNDIFLLIFSQIRG